MDTLFALTANADDILYPLIGCIVLTIIGFFVLLKGGSKVGWLFIIGAVIWGLYIVKPIIAQAQQRATPEQGRGYYRDPTK